MKQLFDLNFYFGNEESLLKDIKNCNKAIIFTPNIDHIIKINSDEKVFTNYSKANFIIADGWPLAFTGRIKRQKISRITGVDLMDNLLKVADRERLNVFFLGAEDTTLDKLYHNVRNNYANINAIGTHNGYFSDNEEIVDKINNMNTNILFVGMGCPKQENWIIENCNRLNCEVFIGVGGAFKILSSEVSRAPKVIQLLGIEWFYRFMKEPTRLYKRYFVEYFKFIPLFVKEIKK